jgi:lia operon protein LiaG
VLLKERGDKMKFNVKKFVIVLVLITVVSFLISGILFYITGGIKPSLITSEQIKTNKSFGTEKVEKIVINTVSPNIKILPGESKDILVDFYGSITTNLGNNSPKLIAEINNNILDISISYPKTFTFGLFDISNIFLDIYIPAQFTKEISATSVSGNINIENFNGTKIQLKTTSGNLSASSLKALEIQADSISGNVYFEKVEGSLKIYTVSGEISTGLALLSDDILIKSTSGKVKLALPSSSSFVFDLESISGDMKNNFDSKINLETERNMKGVTGNGTNTIKIITVSGEITITKE